MNPQLVLSIIFETVFVGSVVLYGYLFVYGLFDASKRAQRIQRRLNHIQIATSIQPSATPKQQIPSSEICDEDIIRQAKAAHYQPAKKWSWKRKLGSGEKAKALLFLAQHAGSLEKIATSTY